MYVLVTAADVDVALEAVEERILGIFGRMDFMAFQLSTFCFLLAFYLFWMYFVTAGLRFSTPCG